MSSDARSSRWRRPSGTPAHDVEIVHDQVVELDPVARRARTEGGRELAYEARRARHGSRRRCARPSPARTARACASCAPPRAPRTSRRATGPATRVVVVGAGFIGCEAAVSLARRGARVTLVADEGVPQERRLGADVGRRIAGWLQQEGVELRLGATGRRDRPGGRERRSWATCRIAADARAARLGRRAPRPSSRATPASRSARTAATLRSTRRWRPRRRACCAAGDVTFAGHAVAGPLAARRALGRRARPGRGRGPPAGGRRRGAVGRRARASGRRSATAR